MPAPVRQAIGDFTVEAAGGPNLRAFAGLLAVAPLPLIGLDRAPPLNQLHGAETVGAAACAATRPGDRSHPIADWDPRLGSRFWCPRATRRHERWARRASERRQRARGDNCKILRSAGRILRSSFTFNAAKEEEQARQQFVAHVDHQVANFAVGIDDPGDRNAFGRHRSRRRSHP